MCVSVAHLRCCPFSFSCVLRFPSTNVKVRFTSLVGDKTPKRVPSPPRTKVLPPLRINIPQSDSNFASPVPSPTGTIRYEAFLLFAVVSHFKLLVYNRTVMSILPRSTGVVHSLTITLLLAVCVYCCVLCTHIFTPFAFLLMCSLSSQKSFSFPKRLISELISRSSDERLVYFYWMHACKIL